MLNFIALQKSPDESRQRLGYKLEELSDSTDDQRMKDELCDLATELTHILNGEFTEDDVHDAYEDGRSDGYDAGYHEGENDGYDEGYAEGVNDTKE